MLYILLGIIGLFVAVALFTGLRREKNDAEEESGLPVGEECCGMHASCGKKLKQAELPLDYFEDQELDLYREIPADAYTDEQIDAFREVLYTLAVDEVGDWLASLEKRGIHLPEILRPEAMELLS